MPSVSPDQVLMVDLPGERLQEQVAAVPGASARPADLSVRSDVHRIAFLCRDDMWSMTGRVLTMDAGWLSH